MVLRWVILAAVIGTGLWSGGAAADPIRFVTIDTAPWASHDPAAGKAVGVFPDLLDEITRRSGLGAVAALQPFARIPRELEAGRQDCTILVWNESWTTFLNPGEVVSSHVIGVIARKGIALNGYDDLRGLSVSMLRGLSLGTRFDGDSSVERQYDTDYAQGLNKLAHGRVDAVAGALPTIAHLAKGMGFADQLGDHLVLSEMVLRLQCTKTFGRTQVWDRMNAAVRDMTADGTIERIKSRWDYR